MYGHIRRVTIAWSLLAGSLSAFAAPHDVETLESYLTPERVQALEQGKVESIKTVREEKDGTRSAGAGVALVLVNAPPETVWEVLTDAEQFHEFMPRVRKVEENFREEDRVGLHYTLKVAWKQIEYHLLETRTEEKRLIEFRLDLDKQHDIKSTSGAWLLRPHADGKTIAVYSVEADTGMAVPAFIENWLMNRDLPGVVEAVKERAEGIAGGSGKS